LQQRPKEVLNARVDARKCVSDKASSSLYSSNHVTTGLVYNTGKIHHYKHAYI